MKVLFAEPDKMFRLMAATLDPVFADPDFLSEFFLTESADPRSLILDWARKRAIPSGWTVALASDEAAFAEELPDADIVVLEKQLLTSEHLKTAAALKLVQLFGRDTSGVDLEACARHGVEVRPLDRYTNLVVAEHTLMLMLALVHQLEPARHAVMLPSRLPPSNWAYNWPACKGVRGLAGLTVGIIGLGEVGQLVAEYLRPMGVKVIYTRRRRDLALEARLGLTFVDMATLVATADLISLHVPGGPDNRHLLDAEALARTKPGVLIVNTARGAVLDEGALVDGLRSGHIAGAGLDVFSVEPLPPAHPLQTMPNVILTPHVGAGTRDETWLDLDIGPVIDAILAHFSSAGRAGATGTA